MANGLKDYEVTQARFIGGQHRAVGDLVQMSERAAKYYLSPYGFGLKVAVSRTPKADSVEGQNVKATEFTAPARAGK